MTPRMRILAIRAYPVARITSLIYGGIGLVQLFVFAASEEKALTLPIGIISPLLWLGVNLTFSRSDQIVYSIMLACIALVCYMATGWLTGLAAVGMFNFSARRNGGIEADFVYDYSTKSMPREVSNSNGPVELNPAQVHESAMPEKVK